MCNCENSVDKETIRTIVKEEVSCLANRLDIMLMEIIRYLESEKERKC